MTATRFETAPPAIEVDGLAKRYWRVKGMAAFGVMLGREPDNLFTALEGIDLVMPPGEVVGVIGYNGAGKSTLLKVVSGVAPQSAGTCAVRGRALTVLEMSTGFSLLSSGRENLRRRLAMYGLGKAEIAEMEPDIIAFAELEQVIDQPTLTYSTGMRARLAFAIVTAPMADVLLLDELLSVGDQYFQAKCLRRLQTICKRGATILMASHDIVAVERFCHRAVWLEKGRVRQIGPASEVAMAYMAINAAAVDAALPRQFGRIAELDVAELEGDMVIDLVFERHVAEEPLYLQLAVHDSDAGILCLLVNSALGDFTLPETVGRHALSVTMPRPNGLRRGIVGVALMRDNSVPSFGVIEDTWGWDNNRLVRFQFSDPAPGGYAARKLAWRRVS